MKVRRRRFVGGPVPKDENSCLQLGQTPPRTCRRATLRRLRQALIPYRSKPVVFKPSVGRARCGALFNLASSDPSNANHVDHKLGLPALRVLCAKSTYTSPRVALAFQKGGIHANDNTKLRRCASSGFLHVARHHTLLHHDPLRLVDKFGQLDAQLGELQRDGIATPTVTVELQ